MYKKEDNMESAIQEHTEEMIDGLQCPKEFSCYTSEFKNLCKARMSAWNHLLHVWLTNPFDCKFSIHYGGIFFCHSPLRVYIAKKLRK